MGRATNGVYPPPAQAESGLSYELVFEPEEGPIRLRLRGARGAKPEIQDKINSFLDARNTPDS